jgi:phosphoribosyl-dephospho-CoA transferase
VQTTGTFPTLVQVAGAMTWDTAAIELARGLHALGAVPRVYGGYGWQVLSGEAYVHPGSDLDLLIEVADIGAARAALPLLQQARLPCRLDGEFVFPDGDAVAWRELASAARGTADRVLVKSRSGARLVGFDAWCGRALELAA